MHEPQLGTISELSDDSRSQMNRHVFLGLLLSWWWAASIYDAFLVYHYRLAIEEQKPVMCLANQFGT